MLKYPSKNNLIFFMYSKLASLCCCREMIVEFEKNNRFLGSYRELCFMLDCYSRTYHINTLRIIANSSQLM